MTDPDSPGGRRRRGMELFEIMPIILGGDPEAPDNKTWLTHEQHVEAVRYWNGVLRELRKNPASKP